MQDGHLTPFTYLTAPNAVVYRHVMGVFVQAKRRFTVHLRPEDVSDAVAGEIAMPAIVEALGKLVEWGNLRADPDTSRVTTVEDFHRARYLYQLSRRGEAVEEAVASYDEALGRRGALQAVALTDIATQLRALAGLGAEHNPDPAKVHLLLRGLVDRFNGLAENAQAFMGSLQRSIELHDADPDVFLAYKDRLIDYLERFINDLVGTGSEIARLVGDLEGGIGRLLDVAARREAEDAAPGDPSDDPGDDPRELEFELNRQLWTDRWLGFHGWFVGTRAHPSQARLLRNQARAAIPQLLQVVGTLNERRSGRSDRSADFRRLARWFAEAPTDEDPHRLWRAVFGLSSARHLTVDPENANLERRLVPPSTPWADGPGLIISARLRRTGSYERRGKPNRVLDRSEQRRHLAEIATRQAMETAAARAALVTGRPARLSDLGKLDPATFRLFLGLLSDALASRSPTRRTVETTTSDGTLAVRLTAVEDGRRAEIVTLDGVLSGPDHLVEIVDLTDTPAEERSA